MLVSFRHILRVSGYSRSRSLSYVTTGPHFKRTGESLSAGTKSEWTMALSDIPERSQAVLEYWFGPGYAAADDSFLPRDKMGLWFRGSPEIDQYITEAFGADVQKVGEGLYDSWRDGPPLSLLAGIILMDQFSRNIHRGRPEAFALDSKALAWADHAVATGADRALPAILRYFVYMPYMHAEDLAAQERGVQLFLAAAEATEAAGPDAAGAAGALRMALSYAEAHRDVVAAWGRFPHRNAALGRASSPEELAGLADGTIKKF
ncbi:hypothetical protein PLESTB_000632000 [Pleodorina starrii]|uniref:DUF924 domain-containing protein n=1 Tax=Pleodorina starrii TaxID=330485 RepID=A0A9W6BIN0_9CHLO|nr:hypothetical protein PLESTB_000632000 [Pleodorina starrii]GLC69712.1 hypothetical protein PLESTF_000869100 [Pleodorina starrii]